MEVDRIYKYAELPPEKGVVKFGWGATEEMPETDYVLGYHSRSKFATEEEVSLSRKEGTNAASVADYTKFLQSLTGSTPEAFYEKWDGKEDELKAFWSANFSNADPKQYLFVWKLSRLLVTGKKFVMYSRGFRLVKNETGDTPTEV